MSHCVKSWQFQLKSVKTIESAEEKLGWIFTAFDEDGGGFMDPNEVAQIVLGLFRLAQQQHSVVVDVVAADVVYVIVVVDEDGGGFMDPDEVAQIVLGLFRQNQQHYHCPCC